MFSSTISGHGGRSIVRALLGALVVALLTISVNSPEAGAPLIPPPNVVVVMVDDVPALDGRLVLAMPEAKRVFNDRGVTFSDFHSETPLCCPARVGFLSGRHTHNHGVTTNRAGLFDPSVSLATELNDLGYFTFLTGKYMNLYENCGNANCAPSVPRGWDRWAATQKPGYFDYDMYVDGAPPIHYGTRAEDYSTDVIASRASNLIREAPAGQRLFGWIAVYATHGPTTPAPRYADAPCADSHWQTPSVFEADVSDKPAYVQAQKITATRSLLARCRALLAVDDLLVQVRTALGEVGRLKNTMLILTGDNGMNIGEHRLVDKSAPYQTQIPFYLSWPRQLGAVPRTVSERLQNIDLAPTICHYAGCEVGPFANGRGADGISFASLLSNATTLDRDAVLDELPVKNPPIPRWHALTTTSASPLASVGCAEADSGGCRWHYIKYPLTGERELYDLSNGPCWEWAVGDPGDPCELDNAISNPAHADLIEALDARLEELRAE